MKEYRAQLEKTAEKLNAAEKKRDDLHQKRKDVFTQILENEDLGQPIDGLKKQLTDIDGDIEISIGKIKKVENELKDKISRAVTSEAAKAETNLKDLDRKYIEALKKAGNYIGRAVLLFRNLGPNYSRLEDNIRKMLKDRLGEQISQFEHIIDGFNETIKTEAEDVENYHQEWLHTSKLTQLSTIPKAREHLENKIFLKAKRLDWD